jgi:hypothetical protein
MHASALNIEIESRSYCHSLVYWGHRMQDTPCVTGGL